jgi:glyoxylase-like metal-dependent hydrolase (beta-lactamase superfamily II)
MAEVKILVEGVHKGKNKIRASSTITLIKSNKNIIVDTGSFKDEQKIINALNKEDLKPKDIDIVVLTHLHLDHTRNANIFSNAVLYVKHSNSGTKWDINDITLEQLEIDDLKIAKDTKIILTPGHFPFHASVVVNTKKGVIVIAGDAISQEKYANMKNIPKSVWNKEEYDESRKKVLEIADYIIPGHGKMFKVEK